MVNNIDRTADLKQMSLLQSTTIEVLQLLKLKTFSEIEFDN